MSNPAVIVLSDCFSKEGHSFRIEDNIGESIHIHYNNLRYDFTVNEFLRLVEIIEDCIDKHIDIKGFKLNNYDSIFLKNISSDLIDINNFLGPKNRFSKYSEAILKLNLH